MLKLIVRLLAKGQALAEGGLVQVSSGIILVMVFLTTVDVILRYVFNSPLPGVLELDIMLVVGLVYLSLPYVQSLRGHIRITTLADRLPPVPQTALTILGHIICLVIFAIITWQGGVRAYEGMLRGEFVQGLINYSAWPARWTVAIGSGFLSLRFFSDILFDARRLRNMLRS
jgi:TRAP-type C4-dicarboxylate transport system permease small subunit